MTQSAETDGRNTSEYGEPGEQDSFRESLLDAGLLLELSRPGLYARSREFERIVQGLIGYVDRNGGPRQATWHFPPVIARSAFEKTGYLRSFPDLIGSVHVFTGNDRDHARLLAQFESGADWTPALSPSPVMLCSAGCHSLYPQLPRAIPVEGITVSLVGQCFRHEPSRDPVRMQAFRMQEFVFVGSDDGALRHRDAWLDRAETLLSGLGLPVERVVANDPFFGRAGRILASGQRGEELKFELVCPVSNSQRPTAIASSNLHRDHFGEEFGISQADGRAAHSSCVGFGLERVTLALLRIHGLEAGGWPRSVREALWP